MAKAHTGRLLAPYLTGALEQESRNEIPDCCCSDVSEKGFDPARNTCIPPSKEGVFPFLCLVYDVVVPALIDPLLNRPEFFGDYG